MNGKVIRIPQQAQYGFILGDDGTEYFFHRQDFDGFWVDLRTDLTTSRMVPVTFESVPSEKGPRAAEVKRIGHPNGA